MASLNGEWVEGQLTWTTESKLSKEDDPRIDMADGGAVEERLDCDGGGAAVVRRWHGVRDDANASGDCK